MEKQLSDIIVKAVESLNEGVIITDNQQVDNPIIYINEVITKMTGYEKEDFIGKNCRFLQGKDKDQDGLMEIKAAMKKAESVTVTLRNYKKNGELFYNQLHITPIKNNNNNITHFIGIQKDITELKNEQERVKKINEILVGREIKMIELKNKVRELEK